MNHMQLPFLQSIAQMIEAYQSKYRRYNSNEKANNIVVTELTEDSDVHVFIIPNTEQTIIDLQSAWNTWFKEYGDNDLTSHVEFVLDYMWKFKV